jgi:hypothetical protein
MHLGTDPGIEIELQVAHASGGWNRLDVVQADLERGRDRDDETPSPSTVLRLLSQDLVHEVPREENDGVGLVLEQSFHRHDRDV